MGETVSEAGMSDRRKGERRQRAAAPAAHPFDNTTPPPPEMETRAFPPEHPPRSLAGLLSYIQGMCVDERPYLEIKKKLEEAEEMAKQPAPSGSEPRQPVPPSEQDETAWLLEANGLCLGTCNGHPRAVTFTDQNAIRFNRKQDAEAIQRLLAGFSVAYEKAIVVEHRWALSRTAPKIGKECK